MKLNKFSLLSTLAVCAAAGEFGSDTSGTGTEAKTGKKETKITTVKMDDGRVVDFPGKRRMQKESMVLPDGTLTVRLDFVNGETRTLTLADSLMAKFATHGAEQKLGDEIAGVKDIDDAVLAIDDLMERLHAGEWTQVRDSSGLAGASILVKALVEAKNTTVDKVKAFLKDKSNAQKLALRNNASIKPIVDRLEAEKAAKAGKEASKEDSGALLEELDGLGE